MRVADFDYLLPDELIAQFPPAERSAARLLHVQGHALADRTIRELPELVRAGDVLVFNNTRVIKARVFGRKATGGQLEMLVERVLGEHELLVQLGVSRKPRAGEQFMLDGDVRVTVLGRNDVFFHVRVDSDEPVLKVLERIGHLPLPPYIQRADQDSDANRYQTVYAREPGAVAAPTAGLHFDTTLLQQLDAIGVERVEVTLHVGAGTFQPVRVEHIAEHRMHHEHYTISETAAAAIRQAQREGRRIMAVGTTSVRALESAAQHGEIRSGSGDTNIFITPGYQFQVVDRLLTNFHLPKSTLLMLVSAFGGHEEMRAAYAHAVAARYRFFSYGDAMLLERKR